MERVVNRGRVCRKREGKVSHNWQVSARGREGRGG